MNRAVAFDLDGVLVDSYELWRQVLNAALTRHGRPPLTEPEFRPHWGQGIEDDIRDWFPGRSRAEIEALYDDLFPGHVHAVRVIEGARDAVSRLRLPSGVVTNSPRGTAALLLRAAGLSFRHVISATDVANPKPAPDMVLELARRLTVAPADLLVVGDSEFDRRAAEAAGAAFHPFTDFRTLVAEQRHIFG